MSTKQKVLDLTSKVPLVDRHRRLWSHDEAVEIAHQQGQPLPRELSEWLHRALKKIACGEDANEVFDVVPEKRGVRKDGFLREMQSKFANGYIAAGTAETSDESKPKKTAVAIKEISEALPKTKQATVRKNWNKLSTDRKPEFSIGKK